MPWYQLRTDSVAAFAEFTLSIVIFLYLLSIKRKSRDAISITAYSALFTLFYCLGFFRSITAPGGFRFDQVHDFIGGAVAIYHLWFSYSYRFNPFRKELSTAIIIFSTMLIVVFSFHFRIIKPPVGFLETRVFFLILFLGYLWSMMVLFRKAKWFKSLREQPFNNEYNILSNSSPALRSFAKWSSLFGLNYLLASVVIVGGKYFGFSPPVFWTFLAIHHIFSLISLIWLAIFYISYADEQTSFQAKLVGLVLFSVLLLLGSLGFILLGTGYIPNSDAGRSITKVVTILMLLVPVITVLIVLGFPYFLKTYLLRPLSAMLAGVQRVNSGDLNVDLPVIVKDEIGYLSSSFNEMTRSLQQYANQMERKVEERTRVIEEKSSELEKQKSILEAALKNLKATQAQLIHQEKMVSLGELTAGIAHEIQNPLNFVNNFSEVSTELVDEMTKELLENNKEEAIELAADLKENLQKITDHGKRASSIVKGMLQHSRKTSDKKETINLNRLVDEYIRLSYHGMRAKNEAFSAVIETHLDNTIAEVQVIPQDIGRVLLNLLNNAFYAVNEKKKISAEDYQPTVQVTTKKTDKEVQIIVKDNGIGIPENVLNKIYQPFFTNKPTGEGTGLGLSLSYDIITKGHGGEMKVVTKEGKGAEFIVSVPINK